jgi:hypothetical protein
LPSHWRFLLHGSLAQVSGVRVTALSLRQVALDRFRSRELIFNLLVDSMA